MLKNSMYQSKHIYNLTKNALRKKTNYLVSKLQSLNLEEKKRIQIFNIIFPILSIFCSMFNKKNNDASVLKLESFYRQTD